MNFLVPLAAESATGVTEAMTTTLNGVRADYLLILPTALGLSALFWGAKTLWSKFRGMAK